jgi:hypothetical protein
MRTGLIALLAVALAPLGCSAASQACVAIPGKGQAPETVAVDTASCELTAQAYKDEHAPAVLLGGRWLEVALQNCYAYERAYVECMEKKGYTFKD